MAKNTKSDPLGEALGGLLLGIGRALKNCWIGMKSLYGIWRKIVLLLTMLLCAAAIIWRRQLWAREAIFGQPAHPVLKGLILGLAILSPLIYLNILAGFQKDTPGAFEEIGFLGKGGKPPRLAYTKTKTYGNRSVKILGYESFIPLEKWRKSQSELEVALDCTIRSIYQGKSKRLVELATVSSELQIPESIPWDDKFISEKDGEICVGEDQIRQVSFNLNSVPHVIVAGETGSGKSVILHTMLWQAVCMGCRIFMIDFKGGVEFGSVYEKYGEVITDRKRALVVLKFLEEENARRLALFRAEEVKKLPEYNRKTGDNLCRIVVFIDEMAEMLDRSGASGEDKELIDQLSGSLSTLARLSRATGINLVLGAQRPDAKVLTGQIKTNIPVRICGRFVDPQPSEIVLGNTQAQYLPNVKGRFLCRIGNETDEFQAYYFEDNKHLHDVDIRPGRMLIDTGMEFPDEESCDGEPRDMPAPTVQKKPPTRRVRKKQYPTEDEDFSLDYSMIEEDY